MNQRIDSFRVLRILHLSMLAGTCLFAIIALIITKRNISAMVDETSGRTLQIAAVVFSLAMLFIGFNLFKRKIMAARNLNGSAEERMMQYRAACVIWWAMIEMPGLFAIICYILTTNLSFFFLAIFHILILLVFMPRKENISLLLNFNGEE